MDANNMTPNELRALADAKDDEKVTQEEYRKHELIEQLAGI